MGKTWVLFLLLLIVASSGCNEEKPEPPQNITVDKTPEPVTPAFTVPEPSTVYVKIEGSKFIPSEQRVIKGTIVRWTNKDSAVYVINVDNTESPPIKKREMWNYTFTKKGTYDYNSSSHPLMPPGRIIVE